MNSIEVKNLKKVFGNFTAVDSINFKIKKGEIFGFLGPNGAGKSTTIRMLCGILEPTSGSGTVENCDIVREPDGIKRIIGYMSQKFSLYDDLTVDENISFYAGIHNVKRKEIKDRKKWIINMAGLAGKENVLVSLLSGGWKQRLALGCAIVHNPKVLFLDEPTAGVDPLSRKQFWELINTFSDSGVTIFVTTHYMDEVYNCDRISLIYNGKLIAIGPPDKLLKQNKTASMEKLFVNLIKKNE